MIVGIDPSLESLGYAFADDRQTFALGLIQTSPKDPRPKRLANIFEQVQELLSTWKPRQAVLENQFAGRNIETLKAINQVTGVVLLACSLAGVPTFLFPPSRIKLAVTGYGRSSKTAVAKAVLAHYKGDEQLDAIMKSGLKKTDDITDALACVLTYYRLREGGDQDA